MRAPLLAIALGFTIIVAAAIAACGADDAQAPRPLAPSQMEHCKSFDELMPRLVAALNSGQTENLRRVIHDHLLVGDRPGDPPPINEVLRAVFGTLNKYAQTPELGAPTGQFCVPDANGQPPSLASFGASGPNPICEMRRSLQFLVHEGKGIDAIALTDPQVAGILNYIIGRPPSASPDQPHYEIATVISHMCQQSAVCDMHDGLDLVVGLTAFAETSDGKKAISDLTALATNPDLQPFLAGDGSQYGGEDGIVALAKVVVQNLIAMKSPSDLDALQSTISKLPSNIQAPVNTLLADGKILLDPNRVPNVLRPLQKVLICYNTEDAQADLVRMIYRLALVVKLPEFGLTRLTGVFTGLQQTDQRGTLLHLVRVLATDIRGDDEAIAGAAKVCNTLFSTTPPPGETRSNAQLALPVIADLAQLGVANEAICAVDTLVYGCTGGAQPACPTQSTP